MDILMPQLGETVSEGTVTVWHKKVGDKVDANEVLFEVSTDKVDTEVPAPAAGVLTEIIVEEGDTVKVGTRLGVLADEGGAEAPAPAAGEGTVDVLMPQLGETVQEGTVTTWHKQVGDEVGPNDILFDVSTDKVDTEVPAPTAGILAEIVVGEGETVAVGTRLAVISGAAVAAAAPAAAAPATPAETKPAPTSRTAPSVSRVANRDPRGNPLSPVVRRLIAEHSLDPAVITGTGANGRIKRDDVLAFVKGAGVKARPAPRKALAGGEPTVMPLTRLRKQIGDHMVMSKATSPHVLQAVEVDFLSVEKARAAHGAAWKSREGFTLTFLPFIARAVCEAIAEFPNVNSSIDGDNLVVHNRINLGIAVDLSFEGLIVPVLKDAHGMSLADIARGIRDLAIRARDKKLSPDDLTEGTYTLSNSGPFGTLITAPVISQPQVAVMSTDGVRKKPVVIEGPDGDSIAIRPVGVVAQSFDHRAFDGAYSAAFLHRVGEILESTDWSTELA